MDDDAITEIARRVGDGDILEHVRWLTDPTIQYLAESLDVDVAAAEQLGRETIQNIINLGRAIEGLGPLGWVVTGSQLPTEAIDEAVRLLDAGASPTVIDAHMTAAWNDGTWIRRSFAPIFTLTDGSDAETDVMLERQRLLHRAADHHESAEYEASTLLVLTQADGLTFDVRGGRVGAFRGATADDFLDDVTVAGLPGNLRSAWQSVTSQQWSTTSSATFNRHAILHGREVAFGTRVNSTKAFAFLRGVIEWLQPQARAKNGPPSPSV